MVNFAFNSRKEVLVVSVILITLCFLPVINAEIQTLGTFKQGECLDLKQVAANFTYCNITSIQYPNSTYTIIDNVMYQRGTDYNYTFCNTSSLGQYIVNGVCTDSSTETVWAYDLYITYNGNETPSGIVIVFFSLAFLIVIGFLSYFFIYNIGHFGQMDYDLGDLIKNVSAYFVLVGIYILSNLYMGNETIDTFVVWIIGITGFTNVAMSFLFFIICFLAKRKVAIENAY